MSKCVVRLLEARCLPLSQGVSSDGREIFFGTDGLRPMHRYSSAVRPPRMAAGCSAVIGTFPPQRGAAQLTVSQLCRAACPLRSPFRTWPGRLLTQSGHHDFDH